MNPNDRRRSQSTPKGLRSRQNSFSLGLALAAVLIVTGGALLLSGQRRAPAADSSASTPAASPTQQPNEQTADRYEMLSGETHTGQAPASSADVSTSGGTPPADNPRAAALVQNNPAVPGSLPVAVAPESYCLWPNDTLSEIATNANVTEEALLAANPGWTGHAGSTIKLPAGSTPPAQWTSPAPQVVTVADLPSGTSGYYLGRDNRQKRVALSFDIGYVDGNFELMKLLADRGIRATFFVLGGAVENHPEMIANILENGHELGNHSYTHDNMLGMSVDTIASELAVTESLVQAAYSGATTKPLFRPPFGAVDQEVISAAASQGYQIVGWTVDSHDWKDEITAEVLYERVTRLVCPGAIIAMHDVNPANSGALPALLDFLQVNGYQFVSVSEILFR